MDKPDSVKNVIDLIDNARIAKKKLEGKEVENHTVERDPALFRRKRKSRKKENSIEKEKKQKPKKETLAKAKPSKNKSDIVKKEKKIKKEQIKKIKRLK